MSTFLQRRVLALLEKRAGLVGAAVGLPVGAGFSNFENTVTHIPQGVGDALRRASDAIQHQVPMGAALQRNAQGIATGVARPHGEAVQYSMEELAKIRHYLAARGVPKP